MTDLPAQPDSMLDATPIARKPLLLDSTWLPGLVFNGYGWSLPSPGFQANIWVSPGMLRPNSAPAYVNQPSDAMRCMDGIMRGTGVDIGTDVYDHSSPFAYSRIVRVPGPFYCVQIDFEGSPASTYEPILAAVHSVYPQSQVKLLSFGQPFLGYDDQPEKSVMTTAQFATAVAAAKVTRTANWNWIQYLWGVCIPVYLSLPEYDSILIQHYLPNMVRVARATYPDKVIVLQLAAGVDKRGYIDATTAKQYAISALASGAGAINVWGERIGNSALLAALGE